MTTQRDVRTNLMVTLERAGYTLRREKSVTRDLLKPGDVQLSDESIGLSVGDIRERATVLTPADENTVIGISLKSTYADSAYEQIAGAPTGFGEAVVTIRGVSYDVLVMGEVSRVVSSTAVIEKVLPPSERDLNGRVFIRCGDVPLSFVVTRAHAIQKTHTRERSRNVPRNGIGKKSRVPGGQFRIRSPVSLWSPSMRVPDKILDSSLFVRSLDVKCKIPISSMHLGKHETHEVIATVDGPQVVSSDFQKTIKAAMPQVNFAATKDEQRKQVLTSIPPNLKKSCQGIISKVEFEHIDAVLFVMPTCAKKHLRFISTVVEDDHVISRVFPVVLDKRITMVVIHMLKTYTINIEELNKKITMSGVSVERHGKKIKE